MPDKTVGYLFAVIDNNAISQKSRSFKTSKIEYCNMWNEITICELYPNY